MPTINSYNLGQIEINGKQYSSDLIIFPDRVDDTWWRDQRHELSLKDITSVFAEKPDILIVGTGASGKLKILPDAQREIKARNITLIAQPTGEACDLYNQMSHSQRVIAILHLTC